jgi:hypothetical protein
MIAKMKSNQSIGATLGYNLKEDSQIIAVNNLVGDHIQDYEKQMRATQELFEGRAKNLTAHVIISPSIEDGQRLKLDHWKDIANAYLKKTSLETYESIVFLHEDREHKHLHIVSNRIDSEGKIYRNGNELAMSQRIGNEIAQEFGLMQAREIMLKNKRLGEKNKEQEILGSVERIKNELKLAAKAALGNKNLFDTDKYFNSLRNSGYKVKEHLNKDSGQLRGYGIEKDGTFYNASDFGKEFTLSSLSQSRSTLRKELNNKDVKKKTAIEIKEPDILKKSNNQSYGR